MAARVRLQMARGPIGGAPGEGTHDFERKLRQLVHRHKTSPKVKNKGRALREHHAKLRPERAQQRRWKKYHDAWDYFAFMHPLEAAWVKRRRREKTRRGELARQLWESVHKRQGNTKQHHKLMRYARYYAYDEMKP